MKAIVAVDRNWAIGNRGGLLVSIPNDHKFFRRETMGKVVIYGRKTLETFPMQQPLDGRTNLILSANSDYEVRNAEVLHSIPALLERLKGLDTDDIYVIGGASVYRELLPYVDTALVTRVDRAYEADAFFPDLDADPDWERTEEGEEQTYFDLLYTFDVYRRKDR